MITLLLLVRATYNWVLFFAHIPFVVNRTFNATSTERLQQYHQHIIQIKVGVFHNVINNIRDSKGPWTDP